MTELEQLAEDVRATAPRPREEFVAQLERRVGAGFAPPSPQRRRPRAGLLRPALALATCALAAVVLSVAVLDRGGGAGVDDAGVELTAPEAQRPEPAPGPPSAAEDAGRAAAPPAAGGAPGRLVEQRSSLALETGADEFAGVTDGVLRVADATGAIVQRSAVTEQDGRGFATYDLRVPASRLGEALRELSELAHVTSRTAATEDITRPYASARDRLADARAERAALLRALQRADGADEADALRRRIRLARQRIAAAERDVAALRRRADRARVDVTVQSTGRPADEGGAWTPGDALDDAGRILEVAAGVALVTLAALVPLLVVGALLAGSARAVRRRRREAALDAR